MRRPALAPGYGGVSNHEVFTLDTSIHPATQYVVSAFFTFATISFGAA